MAVSVNQRSLTILFRTYSARCKGGMWPAEWYPLQSLVGTTRWAWEGLWVHDSLASNWYSLAGRPQVFPLSAGFEINFVEVLAFYEFWFTIWCTAPDHNCAASVFKWLITTYKSCFFLSFLHKCLYVIKCELTLSFFVQNEPLDETWNLVKQFQSNS